MYELEKITLNNYYVNSPTKVGIYETLDGIWLIDSGSDKDAGRRLWKIIGEAGWSLAGIILTHSNADHIGGAKLLQDRSGCRVFARGVEAAITNWPLLEPSFLYGGNPPKVLRTKALMCPNPPVCEELRGAPLPPGIRIIDLPGHFLDMVGVLTPEGVLYCADSVFSQHVIEKYHVSFIYDIPGALTTLESLPNYGAKYYLPAHADLTEDIRGLAEINAAKISEILALLTEICETPRFFEEVLRLIFERFSLEMDFPQYALVGSSIRSYLAHLLDAGILEAVFDNNMLLWKRREKA